MRITLNFMNFFKISVDTTNNYYFLSFNVLKTRRPVDNIVSNGGNGLQMSRMVLRNTEKDRQILRSRSELCHWNLRGGGGGGGGRWSEREKRQSVFGFPVRNLDLLRFSVRIRKIGDVQKYPRPGINRFLITSYESNMNKLSKYVDFCSFFPNYLYNIYVNMFSYPPPKICFVRFRFIESKCVIIDSITRRLIINSLLTDLRAGRRHKFHFRDRISAIVVNSFLLNLASMASSTSAMWSNKKTP